jgi:hypothetical protein
LKTLDFIIKLEQCNKVTKTQYQLSNNKGKNKQKTDPAKHRLEVRTDTTSTHPPPPIPSVASATSNPHPLHPTLTKTSQPPFAIWSPPSHTCGQTAHTKEHHPPRGRSRKTYLIRPPTLFIACSLNHLPPCSPPSRMRTISFHHDEPPPISHLTSLHPIPGYQHSKPQPLPVH